MIINNILPGLTTTTGSDWRGKIEEVKKLDIKEIALFPTCFDFEQRKKLYELLKETPVKSIPHVHIREQDFEIDEIKYLHENYGTIFFNFHDDADLSLLDPFAEYKQYFYLENSGKMLANFKDTLDRIEGLCIDFNHLNKAKHDSLSDYHRMVNLIKEYPIGCCHISAMDKGDENHTGHYANDLSEFDYLKDYLNLLPNIISLELENTFEEQLKVKEYIEKMIRER